MTLLWIVTGASLLVAFTAWSKARRIARRLEQLSEMYWELRYQHNELRAHVHRLPGGDAPEPAVNSTPRRPSEAFVPLTALRR